MGGRSEAEKRLLQAIADDDGDAVSFALGSGGVKDLLRLEVKEFFGHDSDSRAFSVSVASFGLSFQLGDRAPQLAKRNGKQNAWQTMCIHCSGMGIPFMTPDEERIAFEGRLLHAIADDDSEKALEVIDEIRSPRLLLNLQVKEHFGSETDASAFFHSLATYGLRFEVGDTAEQVAARNDRYKVAQALRARAPREEVAMAATATLHVNLRGPSGESIAIMDVENSGRIKDLAVKLFRYSFVPGGCRRELLLGEQLLDPDVPCTTYFPTAQDIDLNYVVVPGGTFQTRIDSALPRPARVIAGGFTEIVVKLLEDGIAELRFRERPFDRGHCAPPRGGRKVEASGTWCVTTAGVRLTLTKAAEMGRHRHSGEDIYFHQQLFFSQQEDGLIAIDSPRPEGISMSRQINIAPGTRLQPIAI